MSAFELEVCVECLDDALRAIDAGATRIEMNRRLDLDGLTPELSDCRELVRQCSTPVIAMLRPHNDGFRYSVQTLDELALQCQRLVDTGVAGIAFGCLKEQSDNDQLDWEALERISECCADRELVLHRVSDLVELSADSLQRLCDTGINRILTSGGAPTAADGVPTLRRIQSLSPSTLQILPGAGVCAENANFILQETGCWQLHGSFRLGDSMVNVQEVAKTRSVMEQLLGSCED